LRIKVLIVFIFFFGFSQSSFASTASDTLLIVDINVSSPNIKTKPSVIIRELSFSKGELMDWIQLLEYHIPRSIANLKNLNLFNQIEITPKRDNETISVTIEVVEKWFLWPIPYIEFADRNINQWSTLDFDPYRTNIGLYVFKYNLFGLNHTAKTTIGTGYTNTLGFEYKAPYIDARKRIGFKLDVHRKLNNEIRYGVIENKEQFFRSDETLVTKTSGFLGFIFRPGLYTRHQLSVNYSNIDISDTVLSALLNPNYLFEQLTEQQLTTFQYLVSYDNRNNKLLPLSGIYANIGLAVTQGDQSFTTVGFDLNFYRPLPLPRMYSGLSYVYQDVLNKTLPYALNKAIGVKNNVRGYEQYLFLGDQFAILRAELRYLIIPERDVSLKYMPVKAYKTMPIESYISAFYDQAQVINDGIQTDIYGFGIGVNTLIYYDKVIRFEYSWNHWNRSGIKLHFKKAF
jgi:outer membrane protein assembly factor BamA